MVTKPTGRPRGRPKSRLSDPRNIMMGALTLATMGMQPRHERSLRGAAKIIAAIEVGNEIELSADIVDDKTGVSAADIAAKCPPGMVALGFGPTHAPREDGSYINTRRGKGMPKTTKGRADTLRELVDEMCRDPECVKRLRPIVDGIILLQSPMTAAKGTKMLEESGEEWLTADSINGLRQILSNLVGFYP